MMKREPQLDPHVHSGADFWQLGCDLEKKYHCAPTFWMVLTKHIDHYDISLIRKLEQAYYNGVAFGRELKGEHP